MFSVDDVINRKILKVMACRLNFKVKAFDIYLKDVVMDSCFTKILVYRE